jgi:hypothetical protein
VDIVLCGDQWIDDVVAAAADVCMVWLYVSTFTVNQDREWLTGMMDTGPVCQGQSDGQDEDECEHVFIRRTINKCSCEKRK